MIFKNECIILLTSIATLLTALAAIYNVIIIKKQNKESRLPDLVIENFKRFVLYVEPDHNTKQFWYWHEKYIDYNSEVKSVNTHKFELDLFNIGIGTSKEIYFQYSLNIGHFEQFLNNQQILKTERLEFNNDSFYYIGKINNISVIDFNSDNQDIQGKISFLKNRDDSFKLNLPSSVLYLFNVFALSVIYNPNRKEYNDAFPPIYLNLQYKDIAGKKYSKNFIINLRLSGISMRDHNVSGEVCVFPN